MVHTLIPSICLLTEHFHINTLTSIVADNALEPLLSST